MKVLSKQDQEVKDVLIAKHDGAIVAAAFELYEWMGADIKPVIEDVLFHWVQTYESDTEQRSDVVFKFRRLMEFTDKLEKIENSLDKKEALRDELKERLN